MHKRCDNEIARIFKIEYPCCIIGKSYKIYEKNDRIIIKCKCQVKKIFDCRIINDFDTFFTEWSSEHDEIKAYVIVTH